MVCILCYDEDAPLDLSYAVFVLRVRAAVLEGPKSHAYSQ